MSTSCHQLLHSHLERNTGCRIPQANTFITHEPRLHVEWFPTCAPELNPAEFIWTQLKEHTASTAPQHIPELREKVFTGVAQIRTSQSRLQYCLSASNLSWK